MNAVPSDDLNGKDWNVKAEREVRRIMAEAMNGKDHDIIAAKMRNSLSRDVSKGDALRVCSKRLKGTRR